MCFGTRRNTRSQRHPGATSRFFPWISVGPLCFLGTARSHEQFGRPRVVLLERGILGRTGAVVLSASFPILKGSGKLPQTSQNFPKPGKKMVLKTAVFFLFPNPSLAHKLPSLFLGTEKKIPSCFDKNPTYSMWIRLPSLSNPAFLGRLRVTSLVQGLIPEVFPCF